MQPTGEDGIVWEHLQALSNGHWPSHGFGSTVARADLAAWVMQEHPNSAYYPYALLSSSQLTNYQNDLADVQRVLARQQHSPAYPHLLLLASIVANRDARVTQGKNVQAATKLYALSRAYAEQALNSGPSAASAHAASLKLYANDSIARLEHEGPKTK